MCSKLNLNLDNHMETALFSGFAFSHVAYVDVVRRFFVQATNVECVLIRNSFVKVSLPVKCLHVLLMEKRSNFSP